MSDTKKDYAFAIAAFLCWFVVIPIMLFAGVWHDGRWFGTAAIMVLVGFLFAGISIQLDKQYAKNGIRK